MCWNNHSSTTPDKVYHNAPFLTLHDLRLALNTAAVNTAVYSGHSFCIGATTTAAQVGLTYIPSFRLLADGSLQFSGNISTPTGQPDLCVGQTC